MTLHIGITIEIRSEDLCLWDDSIKQNALALARTLKASSLKHRVTLVNTTEVAITPKLPWDLKEFNTEFFEVVKHSLDILIVLDGQIADTPSALLKERGVKIIGYKCESNASLSAESIIHNLSVTKVPYYNRHFDALWLSPQVAELNQTYYKVLHRCSTAQTVPFIWSEIPIESACANLKNKGIYVTNKKIAKRLTILEPNTEILKNFLNPLMIAELFYRNLPHCIDSVNLMNLDHRDKHAELIGILAGTNLYSDKRIFLGSKQNIAKTLSKDTDVVISHQWGNPLSYTYLEAAWLGYPLVHNADLCKELGFFYNKTDVISGAEALNLACEVGMIGGNYPVKKKETASHYRERQRHLIKQFLAEQPGIVRKYDILIAQIISKYTKKH